MRFGEETRTPLSESPLSIRETRASLADLERDRLREVVVGVGAEPRRVVDSCVRGKGLFRRARRARGPSIIRRVSDTNARKRRPSPHTQSRPRRGACARVSFVPRTRTKPATRPRRRPRRRIHLFSRLSHTHTLSLSLSLSLTLSRADVSLTRSRSRSRSRDGL